MTSEERLARLALLEAGQRISGIFRNAQDKEEARGISKEIIENILLSDNPRDLEKRWALEPLAGEENFISGLPFFALGLVHLKDDVPVYLALLDPLRDELFEVAQGFPVLLNGREVALSGRAQSQALGSFAGAKPSAPDIHWRSLGAWPLESAYLAAGRLDYLLYQEDLLKERDELFSWLATASGAQEKRSEGKLILSADKNFFL